MIKKRQLDMLEGPIIRSMIVYAVPIILSGILQIFFNAADLAIVGNFASPERATNATAAIGATGSFIALIVNTVMGLSTGVNVSLARAIGAKERETSGRIVHTAMLLSLVAGVFVGIVGLLASPFAMQITKCPPNAQDMAVSYIRIYFLGCPGIFVYNFGSAVLRTKGDSRRPLNFLMLAGITNVVLNFIFVTAFDMDAAGVALATTISQYLAAFLTVRCLMQQEDETRLSLSHLTFHKSELLGIVRYGLPSGFTNAMFSLSNVQIQATINGFGESAVAGSAASGSLESFQMACNAAMNAATLAFAGQNLGAKNLSRVKRVILAGLVLCIAFDVILGFTVFFIGDPLFRLYVPRDPEAIRVAGLRFSIMGTIHSLLALQNLLGAACQAFGYSFAVSAISVVGVFGIRYLWIEFVFPLYQTLESVYYCYPFTWAIISVANAVVLLVAYTTYKKKGVLK